MKMFYHWCWLGGDLDSVTGWLITWSSKILSTSHQIIAKWKLQVSLLNVRISWLFDKCVQMGDVAVIDISAITMGQDESGGQKIPSAESKG